MIPGPARALGPARVSFWAPISASLRLASATVPSGEYQLPKFLLQPSASQWIWSLSQPKMNVVAITVFIQWPAVSTARKRGATHRHKYSFPLCSPARPPGGSWRHETEMSKLTTVTDMVHTARCCAATGLREAFGGRRTQVTRHAVSQTPPEYNARQGFRVSCCPGQAETVCLLGRFTSNYLAFAARDGVLRRGVGRYDGRGDG